MAARGAVWAGEPVAKNGAESAASADGKFRVSWEVDIEGCPDAPSAASWALEIFRGQVDGKDGSKMPVFEVVDGLGNRVQIDLQIELDDEASRFADLVALHATDLGVSAERLAQHILDTVGQRDE
jgi:hypothetical protein